MSYLGFHSKDYEIGGQYLLLANLNQYKKSSSDKQKLLLIAMYHTMLQPCSHISVEVEKFI